MADSIVLKPLPEDFRKTVADRVRPELMALGYTAAAGYLYETGKMETALMLLHGKIDGRRMRAIYAAYRKAREAGCRP